MVAAIPKPKRPDNRARRYALNMKTTKELRDRLEERANVTGRSFTLEVEQQLIKSFELEEQCALQDEIKAEMRGTIAALEARIAFIDERNRTLYPDDSARALGHAFALALTAARHASGRDWREDHAASAIVAGVVRRLMDRNSRGGEAGSMAASLFDKGRIAATADSIATTLSAYVVEALPPLPPLQPQDDPGNWTSRAHTAATFRDKATGNLLQVVKGPEFDLADAEADRSLCPDYRSAIDHFRPIRDTVDVENFIVHALKDGSTSWERLSGSGEKVHVLAGQDAPPAPEPALRPATPDEIASMTPARGQLHPSIGDQAIHDDAVSGLPLVQAEKAANAKQEEPAAAPPAKTRARKAKVEA